MKNFHLINYKKYKIMIILFIGLFSIINILIKY